MVGQGGLNGVLFDPVLTRLSQVTANIEIPLNLALIVVFLALGGGLAVAGDQRLRSFLIGSIVVSAIIWYSAEACGMIFTGMATDFNSGLPLIVMALAVMPRPSLVRAALGRPASAVGQPSQLAPSAQG